VHLRLAVARRDSRAARAAARAVPPRHQAPRQSAPLPGGTRAAAVRAQNAPHHAGARSGGMSALVVSIAAYDYFAAEVAKQLGAPLGEVQRKQFPDGERYLRLIDDVNDRDVVLVGGT